MLKAFVLISSLCFVHADHEPIPPQQQPSHNTNVTAFHSHRLTNWTRIQDVKRPDILQAATYAFRAWKDVCDQEVTVDVFQGYYEQHVHAELKLDATVTCWKAANTTTPEPYPFTIFLTVANTTLNGPRFLVTGCMKDRENWLEVERLPDANTSKCQTPVSRQQYHEEMLQHVNPFLHEPQTITDVVEDLVDGADLKVVGILFAIAVVLLAFLVLAVFLVCRTFSGRRRGYGENKSDVDRIPVGRKHSLPNSTKSLISSSGPFDEDDEGKDDTLSQKTVSTDTSISIGEEDDDEEEITVLENHSKKQD